MSNIKANPEAQEYLCEVCETKFFYFGAEKLRCPSCGAPEADLTLIEDIEEPGGPIS